MTVMPEAKLAREAEMCYALLALPTDYDCWRVHEVTGGTPVPQSAPPGAAVPQQTAVPQQKPGPQPTREALLKEIIGNLETATANAIALLRQAVPALAAQMDAPCPCREALALAIWSDKARVDRAAVERLRPIVGRYFA
jgi:5'-methylthioadenosine phosphorylase